jgi:membrane protein involved in colicin uptake
MKQLAVVLFLIFSTTAFAQRSPPGGECGGLLPLDEAYCIGQQQAMRALRNAEMQRLLNRQAIEDLERERAANQSRQRFSDQEFQNWKSDNPWFNSDRAKTEFAKLYANQLIQERPDLSGLPYLNAITNRVNEIFK